MRPTGKGVPKARLALVLGTLAIAGCVPGAYVYDYPWNGYSGSGYGYYSSAQPGYYYGYPAYYGENYYPPPVVYHDRHHDRYDGPYRDHRDGRSHDDRERHDGDRHDGRYDHDRRDGDGARPPPDRPPPSGVSPARPPPRVAPPQGSGSSSRVPPGRSPCASHKKCGSSGEASEGAPRGDRRGSRAETR